jgi:hypothetical protein
MNLTIIDERLIQICVFIKMGIHLNLILHTNDNPRKKLKNKVLLN